MADPYGNVPYNPGGSTSTRYHNQDTNDEYYTSHTDHSNQDYGTFNYSTYPGASYRSSTNSYGVSTTRVTHSDGSSITPGHNFRTSIYTGSNMRGGVNAAPVVIDYTQNFAAMSGGSAISADEALITIATLRVGIVRGPTAASTALVGSSAPRVFWSGETAGISVMGDAAAIAAQNGIKTLEMTRAGRTLTFATSIWGFNRTRPFWEAASAGFARSSTNGSIAVQGTTVRTLGAWNTIKRPILMQLGITYSLQIIK